MCLGPHLSLESRYSLMNFFKECLKWISVEKGEYIYIATCEFERLSYESWTPNETRTRIAMSSDFRACMSCVVMHSRRFLCVVKEFEFRSSFLRSYFELKLLLSFHCQLSCNLKEFETLSSVAKFVVPQPVKNVDIWSFLFFFFWNTVLVKNKNCY